MPTDGLVTSPEVYGTRAEPGALAFPAAMGGPRRGDFNKMSAWPHAVRSIGAEGLHSTICGIRATRSPRPAARA